MLIASKSIARVKETIKGITKRNRGLSLEQVIKELNLRLPGWVRYFKLAKAKDLMRRIDSWIRHRLRCLKLKQLKNKYTKARTLIKMGVATWQAWILAGSGKGYWRLSASPQASQAFGIKWFEEQGLVSLEKLYLSGL
jgi:RNA-directed DNA polymerase